MPPTLLPIEVNYSMPRTIVVQGNSPKDGRLHQVGENYRFLYSRADNVMFSKWCTIQFCAFEA